MNCNEPQWGYNGPQTDHNGATTDHNDEDNDVQNERTATKTRRIKWTKADVDDGNVKRDGRTTGNG